MALKQLDTREHQEEIEELLRRAREGEVEQEEFRREMLALLLAFLSLSFLQGSRLTLTEVAGNPIAAGIIADNELEAQNAVDRLIRDIYDGDLFLDDDGNLAPQRIRTRAALYANTAAGIYAIAQTFRPDDPWLQWRVGPTEHCNDCLRLDGQVHRASDWQASGWAPRIARLECNGYNCQCDFFAHDGPEVGGF